MVQLKQIKTFFERFRWRLASKPLGLLREVLGFYPIDYSLYEAAFTHNSVAFRGKDGRMINNERLEFLGDSVLAMAVSAYLFKHHPDWDEGQMSKWRGAVVKRAVNNAVAREMHLERFLHVRRDSTLQSQDILGNALEALIGAIYLDRGYDKAEQFILERHLPVFRSIESELIDQTTNYKSILLEWVQKYHLETDFRMVQEPKRYGGIFVCDIWIDGKRIGRGKGRNKKESHQEAAHATLNALRQVNPEIDKALLEEINAQQSRAV